MLKGLLIAIQFLTRFPIRIKTVTNEEIAKSMLWFPFVGGLIGLILASFNLLANWLSLIPFLTAAIILIVWVVITGGLHLDGLSDTCDGFYGGKNKDEILEIMHRGNVGPMGTIGITLILILKYALLITLLSTVFPFKYQLACLILMPMISRWTLVIMSKALPYVKNNDGKGTGELFIEQLGTRELIIATVTTFILAIVLLNVWGVFLCLTGLIVAFFCVIPVMLKIGGINGDTLGLINEVTESGILLMACLLLR